MCCKFLELPNRNAIVGIAESFNHDHCWHTGRILKFATHPAKLASAPTPASFNPLPKDLFRNSPRSVSMPPFLDWKCPHHNICMEEEPPPLSQPLRTRNSMFYRLPDRLKLSHEPMNSRPGQRGPEPRWTGCRVSLPSPCLRRYLPTSASALPVFELVSSPPRG